MSEELQNRLTALEAELAKATPEQRNDLMEHLQEVVLGLEDKGIAVPPWAKSRLADRIDEEVEGQFDNMPL